MRLSFQNHSPFLCGLFILAGLPPLLFAQDQTAADSKEMHAKAIVEGMEASSNGQIDPDELKKYERYVEALISKYDVNDDKVLDKDELKKLRRRPQNADENQDGVVTGEELRAAFGRLKTNRGKKEKQKNDSVAGYVDQLLKQYDSDGDGQLDQTEVANMRRAPTWDKDVNKSGSFDRDELIALIKGKVTPSKASTLAAVQSAARKREIPAGALMAGAMITARKNRSKEKSSKDSNDAVEYVTVEMHLLEISTETNPDQLRKIVKTMRMSDVREISKLISEQDESSVLNHDQAYFDATIGNTIEYGHTVDSSVKQRGSGRRFDAGLKVEIFPEFREGSLFLNTGIQKAFVDSSLERDINTGVDPVRRFSLQSTLRVGKEKFVCDMFSNSGRHWLLIVSVQY